MQQTTDGTIDWRRTADGVELYDEADPDAWIRMTVEAGTDETERPYSICPECGLVSPQRTAPGRFMVCGGCDTEFEVEVDR